MIISLLILLFKGEGMDLAVYLPVVNTSRLILLSLDRNAKLLGRDGMMMPPRSTDTNKKWRNVCKRK